MAMTRVDAVWMSPVISVMALGLVSSVQPGSFLTPWLHGGPHRGLATPPADRGCIPVELVCGLAGDRADVEVAGLPLSIKVGTDHANQH